MIYLPDSTDLKSWRSMCMEMDDANKYYLGPGLFIPGADLPAETTYPHLLGVQGVAYVYIAWREHVCFAQEASAVVKLEAEHIADMDPAWAAQMKLGQEYQWVFARPLMLPYIQRVRPQALRFGLLTGSLTEAVPTWF